MSKAKILFPLLKSVHPLVFCNLEIPGKITSWLGTQTPQSVKPAFKYWLEFKDRVSFVSLTLPVHICTVVTMDLESIFSVVSED